MPEWIKLQKHIPSSIPSCGEVVECKSSDFMGDFTYEASRKMYRTYGKFAGWRFVNAKGEKVETPDYWRHKTEGEPDAE